MGAPGKLLERKERRGLSARQVLVEEKPHAAELVARETEQAARLRELLDGQQAEGGAGVVERGVRIDPGIADRLGAMGYLR